MSYYYYDAVVSALSEQGNDAPRMKVAAAFKCDKLAVHITSYQLFPTGLFELVDYYTVYF